MKFSPVRAGVYLLLAFGGWAAGRWVWPPKAVAVEVEVVPVSAVQAQPSEKERKVAEWEKLLEDMPGEKPVVLKPEESADPAKAGLAMKARAGEEKAADLLRSMARQMALLPPPALAEFLKNATDSDVVRSTLTEDAAVYAFSRDTKAGLTLLSSLPNSKESGAVAQKVLHFFPPKDVPEVLGWYARLPAGELKTAALSEMVPVLKRQNFGKAVALVSALPQDGGEAKNKRRSLLKTLFVDNSTQITGAAAEEKLNAAPAEERDYLRAEIKNAEYQNLANYSKEEAVPVLAGLPENERGGKAVELFQNWAQSDPTRAVKGLAQLPEEMKTPELYSAFAKTWTEGNVGMASQWVHDLPEGPQKEAAAGGLALGLAKDYPAEAMTWAATLTDAAGRQAALQKVIDATPPENLTAAVSALNALNLPPEEKTAVKIPAPPSVSSSAGGPAPAQGKAAP
ncbi:MAG: hypothetical protein V4726_22755 [Verrucomicrobiota bacterium]